MRAASRSRSAAAASGAAAQHLGVARRGTGAARPSPHHHQRAPGAENAGAATFYRLRPGNLAAAAERLASVAPKHVPRQTSETAMADNIENHYNQRPQRTGSSATGWILGVIIALARDCRSLVLRNPRRQRCEHQQHHHEQRDDDRATGDHDRRRQPKRRHRARRRRPRKQPPRRAPRRPQARHRHRTGRRPAPPRHRHLPRQPPVTNP